MTMGVQWKMFTEKRDVYGQRNDPSWKISSGLVKAQTAEKYSRCDRLQESNDSVY